MAPDLDTGAGLRQLLAMPSRHCLALSGLLALSLVALASCGGDPWDYSGQDLSDVVLPMENPPSPPDSPPSAQGIVLVMIDTLRADHLGCYGSERGLTPNLDALAGRSQRFEEVRSTSSWTRSSVAAMFTGRHPAVLNVLGQEDAIPATSTTLAECLSAAGWRCLAVCTNKNASATWGFAQGFETYDEPEGTAGYPDDFAMVPAEVVTKRGLALLDTLEPGERFFLFLLYTDPHDPYLPHPELHPLPKNGARFEGSRRDLKRLDALPPQERTPPDEERIRQLYAGEVRYVDHWVGEFLAGLDARKLSSETLIALTSDHGEGLWDHGWRAHGHDLYQESVHVPLLLHLPGQERGRVISTPVSLVDLAPTLLARAGIVAPSPIEGRDLAPLWRSGERGTGSQRLYAELRLGRFELQAVWLDDAKLIHNCGKKSSRPYELYDLAADPTEKHDLTGGVPHGLEEQLHRSLWRWNEYLTRNREEATHVSLEEVDDSVIEGLRGMGYLGDGESDER